MTVKPDLIPRTHHMACLEAAGGTWNRVPVDESVAQGFPTEPVGLEKDLLDRGLITLGPDPNGDERFRRYHLTAEGIALLDPDLLQRHLDRHHSSRINWGWGPERRYGIATARDVLSYYGVADEAR